MNSPPTLHAMIRMAQRTISDDDVELVLSLGREAGDGYIVLDKDCRTLEGQLKVLLQRVQKLRGKRVIVQDNKVLTAYRTSLRKERYLLRNCEEREIEIK